jgi:hypothetical protein
MMPAPLPLPLIHRPLRLVQFLARFRHQSLNRKMLFNMQVSEFDHESVASKNEPNNQSSFQPLFPTCEVVVAVALLGDAEPPIFASQ